MQAHGTTATGYRTILMFAGIIATLLLIVVSAQAVAADNRGGAVLTSVAPELVIHEPTPMTDEDSLLPALEGEGSISREQILFLEQNTVLPSVAESSDVVSYEQILFTEENTMLPAALVENTSFEQILFGEQNTILPAASVENLSLEQILFIEENTNLPEITESEVLSFERIQFLEDNWAD